MSEPVSAPMRDKIQAMLRGLEAEEGCRILFACESGSRAWGFHSTDSDYDVRFVYARPVAWHLSLAPRRDVIERPIDAELDISGWELRKALDLVLRSNAVLAEWLQSPIQYHAVPGARDDLLRFCQDTLSRKPVTWHYLRLVERQREGLHLPDGRVKMKRYLYTLRPALALRWMRRHDGPVPPMNMAQLIDGAAPPQAVADFIDRMIAVKRTAGEAGTADGTDPACDALIEAEVAAARDWLARTGRPAAPDRAAATALHIRYTRLAGE